MNPQSRIKLIIKVLIGLLLAISNYYLILAYARINYAEENRKVLSRIFSKDELKGYYIRGTPVGTFGVGTMYLNEKKDVPVEQMWLIGHPNSWFKDDLPETEKEKLYESIVLTGNFVDRKLTDSSTRDFNLAFLTNILQVFGIDADADHTRNIKVKLTIGSAFLRKLDWLAFKTAIRQGKMKQEIKDAVRAGNYKMCAADIVFKGYSVTIEADKNLKLAAELSAKAKLAQDVGEDAKLKLGLTDNGSANFTVTARNPIIVAVLYKAPPPPQGEGPTLAAPGTVPEPNIDQWEVTDLSTVLRSHELILSPELKKTENKPFTPEKKRP